MTYYSSSAADLDTEPLHVPAAVGRIEFAPSAGTSFYTYPGIELVRTKQDARERITAALADDKRFAHWKRKEVAQLVDALVDALSQSDVSLT